MGVASVAQTLPIPFRISRAAFTASCLPVSLGLSDGNLSSETTRGVATIDSHDEC